jgi:hypothetical protein
MPAEANGQRKIRPPREIVPHALGGGQIGLIFPHRSSVEVFDHFGSGGIGHLISPRARIVSISASSRRRTSTPVICGFASAISRLGEHAPSGCVP